MTLISNADVMEKLLACGEFRTGRGGPITKDWTTDRPTGGSALFAPHRALTMRCTPLEQKPRFRHSGSEN
jgi:hypothetical protein